MKTSIYFFIILFLCIGILTGTASLYYYENNVSYYKFAYSEDLKQFYNYYNFGESKVSLNEIRHTADNNMKYNDYLIAVLIISLIDILITLPLFIRERYFKQ